MMFGQVCRIVPMVALAFAALLAAVSAQAADRSAVRLSYYMSGDGAVGFVLDRTGSTAAMQFSSSGEVIPLRAVQAARGDMLLKDANGTVVLRVTTYGPATYFPDGDMRGIPLVRANHAKPLTDAWGVPGGAGLKRQAALMEHAVSASLGIPITFEADWTPYMGDVPGAASLFNAVKDTAAALAHMARRDRDRADLEGLTTVRFENADRAGLNRDGETLVIYYIGGAGGAGRPSPAAIIDYLSQP